MLVLTRKLNESLVVGNNIRITVIGIKGDRIRLGIEAPHDVCVDRGEVHARKMKFVDVPVAGFCDATVDLGGSLSPSADDTAH